MKKQIKKLALKTESLRILKRRDLNEAVGGFGVCSVGVPSNPPTACMSAQSKCDHSGCFDCEVSSV